MRLKEAPLNRRCSMDAARQSCNQRDLTAENAKSAEVESNLFAFSVFSAVKLLEAQTSVGTTNGCRYLRVSSSLACALSSNRSVTGSNFSGMPSCTLSLAMSTPLASR